MSIEVMSDVWKLDLPHAKKFVLLALADHANDYGRDVFPSVERVAWKTGYSRRQVQRIMHELTAENILKIEAAATRRRPIEYSIHTRNAKRLPPFREGEGERGAILTPHQSDNDRNDSGGVTIQTVGVTKAAANPAPNVTLTVKRNVKETSEEPRFIAVKESIEDPDGAMLELVLRYERQGGWINPAAPRLSAVQIDFAEKSPRVKTILPRLRKAGIWPPGEPT